MYAAGSKRASAGPRILVVRLGAMGDIIHALPAVATLKHSFPQSRIAWAVDPKWAALLDGNPFVDRLIPMERRTLAGLRKAWRDLREERFDFAVDFQGLLKSALVASVARPDRIYGFHQAQLRERAAALIYSNKVMARMAHVVDRNLELARSAGATSILHAFPLPAGMAEGELPAGDFVLAGPLAGWLAKQWPLEYYGILARRLRQELGLPLVLNGPPGSGTVLSGVGDVHVHLSGVPGLIHATHMALGVVGIDSGPMHLAAALGKPGVAIFGPTNPERNGPYGDDFTVLRRPDAPTSYKRRAEIASSMKEISPEDVFLALAARLSGHRQRAGCA
jgi:heptosyltransferase-1